MNKVKLNIVRILLLVLCFIGVSAQAKIESEELEVKNQANKPKVSVIIPVYNTEEYLRECMDSIVNQTLKDIEIICVNDGSTDKSLEILRDYERKDERVIVIDKEHKNAGAARNAGLEIAKGDYLVFVDSDDYAEPDYLKLMYEKIVADDADVCVCNYKRKYEGTNIIKERMFNIYKPFSYRDFPSNFMSKVGLIPWNKMIRKSLVTRNNLSFQEIKRFNDSFFSFAVTFKSNKIVAINKPIYIHRVGDFNHLQNSIHDDLHLIFDAADKIYKWIIDQGIYKDVKSAFVDYVKKNTDYVILKLQKNDQTKDIQGTIDEIKKERDSFLLDCERQEQINKKHVPIAMATDNNYVLPTIVSMTSMLENANEKSFYKYYLLVSGDFTDENRNKLLSLQEKYRNKCEIKFINMDDAYESDRICNWFTTAMYYRLSLPSLLKDEDKCIYVDVDTIVNKDLSELYDINIDEYYLAGVKAAGLQSNIKRAKFLDISDMQKYINSGVLLMNLKKMRDEKVEDKFSKFIKEKVNTTRRLTCPDQDTINAVCYDKIKILPLKYNAMVTYECNKKQNWENNKKYQKCFSKLEWDEAGKNPVIIHYACKKKPWNSKECNMLEIWWKYASKTGEYNEIKKQFWYGYLSKLSEKEYPVALKEWYKEKMGYDLDLDHPQTYTEKMQWLKLNDMDELKTKLADKYLVRDWVKEKISEKYLTKLLGVWDNFDDIDFDQLPDKFVLKANHGCGWNIIITDKSKFNKEDARRKFDEWLNTNYAFKVGLELQYKNIKPKIIAEEYLENENNDLYDYKVWCFDGKPYYTMFLSERKKSLKMAFYDNNWNLQPFYYTYKWNNITVEKPDNLDEILNLSKKLSEGFRHVRVDFYRLNDGTLKFGEMTFTSASGSMKWYPKEYNKLLGDLIKLPTDNDSKEKSAIANKDKNNKTDEMDKINLKVA